MNSKIIMKKNWIILLLLIPLCIGFYKVNTLNYEKHRSIESHRVNHPEMVPNSQLAQATSFGFRNMFADIYWIQSVQYIGGNVISEEYKKYLYAMLDLITDLNPYFESPYVIGQLLLPSENMGDETIPAEQIKKNVQQGEILGLKGVKNFCDAKILEKIREENDLQKITKSREYKNPCQSYKIPYYLGFIYYFYLKDGSEASFYYKVVAAQEDAPSGAKVLAAIMQGKWGQREKSVFMFLSLAKSLAKPDEYCSLMTEKVDEVYQYISQEKLPLTGELVAAIENDRNRIFPKLTEDNEDELLGDTQCTNYLAKATREINLIYIEEADARYKKDHPDEISAKTPQVLFEKWYISFIPTDFQQYEDEDYGIIYKYNPDIGRFDYEMGY